MGTPNSYFFNCPQCGGQNELQAPGEMAVFQVGNMCDCQAKFIEGKEEVCQYCKFLIRMVKKEGMRKVFYIEPSVVTGQ